MFGKVFWDSLNWHLLKMFCAGCLVFLLSKYIIPLAYTTGASSGVNDLSVDGFVLIGIKGLLFLSYLMMGTSVFTFLLQRIFSFVWKESLKGPIDTINSSLEVSLNSVAENTGKVVQEALKIHEVIKGDSTRSIDACKTEEDYMYFINNASKIVYGNHIKDKKSLYSFIFNNLIGPYCCDPHFSNLFKKVDIRPYNSRFVEWNEYTKMDIHHVDFQNMSSDFYFDYEYEGASLGSDIDKENWAQALTLSISFDGRQIIGDHSEPVMLDSRPNSNDEGFFCWKEEQWIYLRYKKLFKLKKERTEMIVTEKSLNSIDDTVFTINTFKPICSYKVDMTLPENFCFRKGMFISPILLNNGLPEHAKENEESLTVVNELINDRHIDIDIKGWILPGLVMNINWYRTGE